MLPRAGSRGVSRNPRSRAQAIFVTNCDFQGKQGSWLSLQISPCLHLQPCLSFSALMGETRGRGLAGTSPTDPNRGKTHRTPQGRQLDASPPGAKAAAAALHAELHFNSAKRLLYS